MRRSSCRKDKRVFAVIECGLSFNEPFFTYTIIFYHDFGHLIYILGMFYVLSSFWTLEATLKFNQITDLFPYPAVVGAFYFSF